MKKTIVSIILSALTAFSVAACTGTPREMTAEEIRAKIEAYASAIPETAANGVNLTPSAEGGYEVSIDLTWNEDLPAFSTEKALEKYSSAFASELSSYTPGISAASIAWTVPTYSAAGPSIAFSFSENDGALERTGVEGGFSETTIAPNTAQSANAAPKTPARKTEEERPYRPVPIIQSPSTPRHKSSYYPQINAVRHKTAPPLDVYAPRHKSNWDPYPRSLSDASKTERTALASRSAAGARQGGGSAEQAQAAQVTEPTQTTQGAAASTAQSGTAQQTNGSGGGGNNFNTYNNTAQQETGDAYVLNSHTKKFHRPSCSDVPKIAPQNYSTSNLSRETILSNGYSPCKHCNP